MPCRGSFITFEWDDNKNLSNIEKHGISFDEATNLWIDTNAVQLTSKKLIDGEKRFLIIGKFKNRIWAAIFTMRRNNVRIISVRRARSSEEGIYLG